MQLSRDLKFVLKTTQNYLFERANLSECNIYTVTGRVIRDRVPY